MRDVQEKQAKSRNTQAEDRQRQRVREKSKD